MLDGIKRALETAPDIKVVGEAMSGEEMLTLVPRVRPDVVILDLRMPKGDGLTTLAALRKQRNVAHAFHVEHAGAAEKARARGVDVIMNRCPKIEYQRLFGELRMGGFNTGIVSSRL